ncbi:domain containing E3 ubiquitin protein ligase [Musa troglodytarum]|uniref:Domain containing E3 ubiquitin protein ligase n=1 Tax=Musa troglodytarum TaxID=320322 RepID=A0A9E7EUB5_9LILI|nr:domain containing E3 ubiquitin protein ligase [Musa troglodytarum]
MDSQNRAQDLATTVLAAVAPPEIAAACSAVDSFLRRHASDQSRAFFSVALPALICRIFGFDDVPPPSSSASSAAPGRPASTAWIDQAASDPALAGRLLALLAPDGILISSISAVDRHALVRYVFPVERLPEWIRFALQSDRPSSDLSDLCPLLKGRVKEDAVQGSPYQMQLNAFEYFMFWFAYYPVCRGNSESPDANVVRKSRKFRLEKWTSSLPVLCSSSRRSRQKPECNLYLQLLDAYLHAFVPKNQLSYQPYRSSLLHYSLSYDDTAFLQAEFLVYTFVHFWMIDNDFSPLPVNVCRSFGLSFPYKAVLGEAPPTAGLGDVLKVLVKYLNCDSIVSGTETRHMVYGESPRSKGSLDVVSSRNVMLYCENSVGSWNTVIQRPLYRFILRSFLFCPIGASIKNASQVFYLWMSYLEPWNTSPEEFSKFDPAEMKKEVGGNENINKSSKGKQGRHTDLQYSLAWESYVLSNYLFYSSLVMHFLGFAHKFLHTNVESVIQMILKVLKILTSSKELLDLIRKVDVVFHSKPARASAYSSNDAYKYIPSICEQLQDWEDGLCESDADGSFLHENWNHDLRLFSDGEDGAHNLLQLLVLRAEHEIQISSGDVSNSIQALDAIRSQMNILFGGPLKKPLTSTSQADDPHHGRGEIFTPKHPGIGQRTWADVRYKGEWMRRPISDTEVAWLARLLIRFSDWLNESFGLDHVDDSDSAGPTIVEFGRTEVCNVEGPKEALSMVLALLGSWLSLFRNVVVRFMRAHRIKINLRVLASKKFAMLLLLYAVFCAAKKVLSAAFAMVAPA